MENLEAYKWKNIEELEWTTDHDYKRISQYLKDNFTIEESLELAEFVNNKADDLQNRFHNSWLAEPGIAVSDDGWDDLTSEVVGRGEDFYKNITEEKLQEMAINLDYHENFRYSFQFTYEFA
jgi:hypothetical protein